MFTEEQIREINSAREQGVKDTQCSKHREWSPLFMNFVWNRELENKKLCTIPMAAHFLTTYFPKENGMFVTDIEQISYVMYCYDNGLSPVVPEVIDNKIDNNKYIFEIVKHKILIKGNIILKSGRVRYVDVDVYNALDVLMSEGGGEVLIILGQLKRVADAKSNRLSGDYYSQYVKSQWSKQSILLTLDDMNIRGYQVKYAFEYADRSIGCLYDELSKHVRSKELCDYINMKSAIDWNNGIKEHNQIAVSGGASIAYDAYMGSSQFNDDNAKDYNITSLNVEKYLNVSTSPKKVDWSQYDVVNGIDINSALLICNARGFEVVSRVKNFAKDSNDGTESFILYNKDTNDYISASSAMQNDFCYGGAELTMYRTFKDSCRNVIGFDCSSGPINKQAGRYYEITQTNGLFRYFKESLCGVPGVDYDWFKIGFGHNRIPIPAYVRIGFLNRNKEEALCGKLKCIDDNMWLFYFCNIFNAIMLLFDENVKSGSSKHYLFYNDWFFSGGFLDVCSMYSGYESSEVELLNIILTYTNAPESIITKLIKSGTQWFQVRDDKENEGLSIMQKRMRGAHRAKDFSESSKMLLTPHKYVNDLMEALGIPRISELPIKVNWDLIK